MGLLLKEEELLLLYREVYLLGEAADQDLAGIAGSCEFRIGRWLDLRMVGFVWWERGERGLVFRAPETAGEVLGIGPEKRRD
jgi:hypothetical protein